MGESLGMTPGLVVPMPLGLCQAMGEGEGEGRSQPPVSDFFPHLTWSLVQELSVGQMGI